jgi:hypothetical protein
MHVPGYPGKEKALDQQLRALMFADYFIWTL